MNRLNQVSVTFKVILYVAKITQDTASSLKKAAEFVVCKFTKAGYDVGRMIYKLFIMKPIYE